MRDDCISTSMIGLGFRHEPMNCGCERIWKTTMDLSLRKWSSLMLDFPHLTGAFYGGLLDGLLEVAGMMTLRMWWLGSFPNIPCVKRSTSKLEGKSKSIICIRSRFGAEIHVWICPELFHHSAAASKIESDGMTTMSSVRIHPSF